MQFVRVTFIGSVLGMLLTVPLGCGPRTADETSNTKPAESQEPAPETSPAAQTAKPTKVMLGEAELTAGIPGEGPLTIEQIQTWLADDSNHQALEVELPLGLLAGASQVKGLEDNPLTRAKIELGRQLYFDPKLSVDGTISCASCHHPDSGYAKETQFGVGVGGQTGNRNSPVSYNRILSDKQFWDGRAASLEEQAVGPMANPIEMGNTHDVVVDTLKGNKGYQLQFEKVFDDGVTIDNAGKALAAFERVLVTGPAPYDHFEVVRVAREQFGEGAETPLTEEEREELREELEEDAPEKYEAYLTAVEEVKDLPESAIRGRELFFSTKADCTACHVGANFTDEKYHNLGVGMDKEDPDLGRFVVTKEDKDRGAFKTPTLRNVELTAPYMHDGSQATLEEVVEWYAKGGHPNPHLSDKIKKLELSDQDKQDLVAFMKSLTGPFPEVEQGRFPQ